MRTRKVITISLPPALLRRAEQVAREENRTTSELLGQALRFYVDAQGAHRAAMRDRVIALMDQIQERTRGARPGDIRRVVREAVESARRRPRRASA
jgi:metal-responsive CopG/Arc/MetJ family transcriptional regulator